MAEDQYQYEVPELCLGEAIAEISRRGGMLKGMSDVKDGVAVIDVELDAESDKSYKIWLAELIAKGPQGIPPYCSFCGKGKDEVKTMVKGPAVFICDECVSVCQDIIREQGFEG